jgi:hypothetical protein
MDQRSRGPKRDLAEALPRVAGFTRRAVLVHGLSALALTGLDGCRSDAAAGWVKADANPVLGGSLGTCFDCCVIRVGAVLRMYFSWRPKKSIALVESLDGVHWSTPGRAGDGSATIDPQIVLGPNPESGWEMDINRPVVVQRGETFHMWYTGQTEKHSFLGYAQSSDGLRWRRMNRPAGSGAPVLSPQERWEGVALMAPHVLWDERVKLWKMWYSGGEQYEPNAIGYATSPDGVVWTRSAQNPILKGDKQLSWEQERVTAAAVALYGGFYYAFYIGFRDVNHAAIGIARSRDGVSGWQRLPQNPILEPSRFGWDRDACYKPSVVLEGNRWRLWYNGRRQTVEQIGLATHEGADLGF